MIVSGLVLFLFGTAVSAGPYIAPPPTEIIVAKNKLSAENQVVEYYPSSKGSPFISNFIQKGTNVFFKPQFMLSAAQMPPQVQAMIAAIEKDDCKTAYPMGPVPVLPIVEEPLRVIEKEFIAPPEIKEIIEINPAAFPAPMPYKAPLLIQEPYELEQLMVPKAPLLPTYIPRVEIPAPAMPVMVKVEEPRAPVVIPPAPLLPPLEMPTMPMMLEEVPMAVPIPQAPMMIKVAQAEEIVMPAIPPVPVLAPLELPKVSMLVEEPCAPFEVVQQVEPIVMPAAPIVPTLVIEEKPLAIPEAPVLPPLSMPKLPVEVIVEENIMANAVPVLPCDTVEIVEQHIQPMLIPEAPLLPPLAPLEIPAPVIIEESVILPPAPVVLPPAPVLPPLEMNKIVVERVQPMLIPEAPVLAPLKPLEIPATIMIEEPVKFEVREEILKPVVLPAAPLLPPLEMAKAPLMVPVPCETVEIVEEHVKPMLIPEAPVLPPLAPMAIPAPIMIEEPVKFEVREEILKPVIIPAAPLLPPLEMAKGPLMVPVPCETVEIVEENVKPMLIPEAPLLAPLAPMAFSTPIIVEEPAKFEVREEILQPVVLPPAPLLPPLELSKMMIEKPAEAVVAPCPPGTEIIMQQRPVMPVPFAYSELSLNKPVLLPSEPFYAPKFAPLPVQFAQLSNTVL